MRALELKVPPVAVAIIFATAMWLLSDFSPGLDVSLPLRPITRPILTLILVLGGIGAALSGIVSFKRADTTVNPLKLEATSALVNSGIYRYTRNPMYLGFLIVLFGWAVFLANALAAIALPGFVLYMNRFQIIPEERALTARFGKAFSEYAEQVRRWL